MRFRFWVGKRRGFNAPTQRQSYSAIDRPPSRAELVPGVFEDGGFYTTKERSLQVACYE
jgi:hypothetical protein